MINKLKTNILALIISFGASFIFAQKQDIRNTENPDCVFVAAHRGDWLYAPENSIKSLEHSIFFGADIMETDVRLTKDQKLVIMHDYDVDRTTTGKGKVADLTLAEIKKLTLVDGSGIKTNLAVPTLDEYTKLAKDKIYLYLDKAGYDLPEHPKGFLIKKILEVIKKNGTLEQTIFVLDFPYSEAKSIFGEDLEKVIYCPVIEDDIPNLEAYVAEYIEKLNPVAFQFRIKSESDKSYQLLETINRSKSKAFVAATWRHHTADHDDIKSIFERPSSGWGWLIDKGFRIIETNYPKDLIQYLKSENRR
ncbi:MAG: glycerophosphodiester phosphodiesterase family protein [Cruoricaptor ignavus]|nr:glycerophosphodiester phosphodiesterase family protein [Cruoricaptor ignavus]